MGIKLTRPILIPRFSNLLKFDLPLSDVQKLSMSFPREDERKYSGAVTDNVVPAVYSGMVRGVIQVYVG